MGDGFYTEVTELLGCMVAGSFGLVVVGFRGLAVFAQA
jgi:hypothetical protein